MFEETIMRLVFSFLLKEHANQTQGAISSLVHKIRFHGKTITVYHLFAGGMKVNLRLLEGLTTVNHPGSISDI